MKKFLISALFVLAGSSFWWGLSNVARFSFKKWDAKFDSVLQHSLTQLGVDNTDLVASVNEVKNDANGSYVERRMTVQHVPVNKIAELTESLEDAGASVRIRTEGKKTHINVFRGSRLYQEITLLSKI